MIFNSFLTFWWRRVEIQSMVAISLYVRHRRVLPSASAELTEPKYIPLLLLLVVVESAVKRIDNSTNWSAACPLGRFLLTSPFLLLVTRGKQHHLLVLSHYTITVWVSEEGEGLTQPVGHCILDQSWTTQTLFAFPHFVAVGRQFRILTTTTPAEPSHH